MRREDLREFHHITAIANVPSIIKIGILAHDRAKGHQPVDIADPEVQERRRRTIMPSGRRLHEYACLYVDARNAMLYRLVQEGGPELAVIAVHHRVLDRQGVMVTDRNAASGVALIYDAPRGVAALDPAVVHATWWNQDRDTKQRRCAEVLVPDVVPPDYLLRAYVATESAAVQLRTLLGEAVLDVQVNAKLFYLEEPR